VTHRAFFGVGVTRHRRPAMCTTARLLLAIAMFCSSNQTNFKKALQLYRPKQLVAVIVERALNSLSDHELFYTSRYSANIKQDHDR